MAVVQKGEKMPINIGGITINEDGTITGQIIDFEPVVHCEDCEFSSTPEWDSDKVYCTKQDNWFKINEYCHLGRRKRREDEADRRR